MFPTLLGAALCFTAAASLLPAATVSVQPNAGVQSAVQIVLINGSGTHFAAAATKLSFGPGVTVSSVFVSGPTQLQVGISLAANAPAGSHTVTVTTGSETASASYTVQAAPQALKSLSVNAAAPGASNVTVQLQGTATAWVNGKTVASFGPGVSVGGAASGTAGPVTVTSSTTATAVLSVDAAATLSTRTVAVQTGSQIETVSNAFTIQTCGSYPATATIPYPAAIPINGLVQIPFSAPLNRSSVVSNTFQLSFIATNRKIPAIATLDATGAVLTLSPAAVLPVNDGFGIQSSPGNVIDACGFAVYLPPGGTSSTFQPPGLQIVTTNPVSGQNNFVSSSLAFAFNQPILPGPLASGVSVMSAAGPVAGTFSLPSPSRALFTPNAALTPNTVYTIAYTKAITNAAGDPLANPGGFSFRTGPANSAGYPTFTLSPLSGATGVPTNVRAALDSTLPFDPTTIDAGSLVITDLLTGNPVPTVVSLSSNLLTLSAKSNAPLQPNRPYSVAASPWGLASNFTTGAGSVTNPASVALLSPANKAAGVPLNAVVDVQFSRQIDLGSLSPASISVTPASGSPIQGATLNPNSDGLGFTWTPPYSGLSASTTYAVKIAGLVDLDGTPMTPSVTSFTTGTSPTYGYGALSVTPAGGAVNVPQNAHIVITAGAPLDPISTSNLTILTASDAAVPGAWAVSGNVATFTPAQPYPSAAVIRIGGSLATDTGVAIWISQSFTVQSYTGNAPAFSVVGIAPANNLTGVSPSASIVIRVSEPVANPPNSAVQIFNGDQFVSSLLLLSSDHKTITIQPYGLQNNTTVTVVVTANLTDIYGTPIAPFTSRFSTALNSPSAFFSATTRPNFYSNNVPATAHIFILLSHAGVDQASVQSGLLLTANGDILEATATFPDPELIEIVPAAPFPAGSTVNLSLNAHDIYGNALSFSGLTFDVAGAGPLPAQVIANSLGWLQSGSSSPVIELEYDQPLDGSSLGPNDFVLQENPGVDPPVPVTVSFAGSSRNVIVITPQSPLKPYQYSLGAGLQSIQGANGIPAQGFASFYTVPAARDSTPASLVGVIPDNNWKGVGTNAEMTLAFDKQLDELSISAGTLKLTSGTQTVPINWSFVPFSGTIRIDPVQFLASNTLYTLSYSGFVDIDGNPVSAGSVTFTTGAGIDAGPPQLLSFSPSGQTLPVNSSIVMRFDQPIASYPLSQFPPQPGASWTFSADRKTVTFTPAAPWPPNSTVSVGADILDETGIASGNGGPASYFTTGYAASTSAPAITGTNPKPGASGLPRNVNIQVAFTTAISPLTLGSVTLQTAGGSVAAATSLSPDGTSLFIRPADLLSANTSYQLTIAGVADTEGHPIAAPYILKFTTGPGTLAPGNIVAENPTGQPAFLGPRSPVTIFYSQPVNPLTVAGANFAVSQSIGLAYLPVDGTLSIAPDSMSIAFNPDQPWTPGATYSVGPGNQAQILDIAGNSFTGNSPWTFTAPAVLTTGTLAVSSVSPANTSTAPANADVQLLFTDNVDPGTVSPSTVRIVARTGTTPPGTFSVSGPLVTFVLAPGVTWSPGVQYTVQVSGITNESGALSPPFTSTFTAAAATANPSFLITAVSPANGTTLSSNTTPILITFNEPPDPLTVANLSVGEVSPRNGPIAGLWSVHGNSATFTPSSPYPPNTVVEVGGFSNAPVTDLAGDPVNWSPGLFPAMFTTAKGTDTTSFKLVSVSPANGASQLGLTPSVTLRFSQSVATGTLNGLALYEGDALAPAGSSYSPDGRTVVLTPAPNWSYNPGAVMTVVGTAQLKDLSGNSLQPFESSFSLISSAQENGPVLQSVRPATGAASVPANAPISFFVSGSPLNAATVAGAVHVYQNGIPAAGTARLIGSNIIQFTGTNAWNAGAVLSTVVSTSLADVNGHTLASQFESSFTVAATPTATPQLLMTNFGTNYTVPTNGRLELLFDQPLDPASVTTDAFELFDNGTQEYVAFKVALAGTDGNTVVITPESGFSPSGAYTLSPGTTLLRSVAGGVFQAANEYSSFWTASQAAHGIAISQIDPPESYPVPTNAAIRISFSGQADPLTLNPQNITLQAAGHTQPYSLMLPLYNSGLGLIPLAPLPPNTTVTVSITGVTDMAGNSIARTTSQFVTGAGPAFNWPQLLGTEPGQSGYPPVTIPTNTKVFSLAFDEPIDPESITSAALAVQENGVNLPGVLSQSPDGKTVLFTASQPLTAGSGIVLTYSSLADLAGNTIPCCTNFEFTVGSSAAKSPLSLTASVPGPNWKNVPVNVNLQLLFSTPPDMTTLSGVQLLEGSTSIPLTPVVGQSNGAITLQTSSLLVADQNYTLNIAGVRDVAGNPLTKSASIPFTTGPSADLGPFTGVLTNPANPSSASPTTPIKVQFSAPVNPIGLNMTLRNSNYQAVPVSFSLSSDGMTATWTPTSPLSSGSYTFDLGAVDDAGNLLSSDLYTVITVP